MRPEISYPIIKLSQFATNPATIHHDAVFGMLQYLLEHAMMDLQTIVQCN
jgi:hypothetical protein